MATDDTIVDVPASHTVVFGSDGRVFIDLDYLIEEYQPIVDSGSWDASLMLDAIKRSVDTIKIETSLED